MSNRQSYRWTVGRSSLRGSRKLVSNERCDCSYCSPRSPKLNGHMERSHRTHNEEFCEVMAASDQLPTLNRQLRRWEKTYNCVRPHQSLAYLTPLEFITRWKLNLGRAKCH